jgi:hypothetical protein
MRADDAHSPPKTQSDVTGIICADGLSVRTKYRTDAQIRKAEIAFAQTFEICC